LRVNNLTDWLVSPNNEAYNHKRQTNVNNNNGQQISCIDLVGPSRSLAAAARSAVS